MNDKKKRKLPKKLIWDKENNECTDEDGRILNDLSDDECDDLVRLTLSRYNNHDILVEVLGNLTDEVVRRGGAKPVYHEKVSDGHLRDCIFDARTALGDLESGNQEIDTERLMLVEGVEI